MRHEYSRLTLATAGLLSYWLRASGMVLRGLFIQSMHISVAFDTVVMVVRIDKILR